MTTLNLYHRSFTNKYACHVHHITQGSAAIVAEIKDNAGYTRFFKFLHFCSHIGRAGAPAGMVEIGIKFGQVYIAYRAIFTFYDR